MIAALRNKCLIHRGACCAEVSRIREASSFSPVPIGCREQSDAACATGVAFGNERETVALSSAEMGTNFIRTEHGVLHNGTPNATTQNAQRCGTTTLLRFNSIWERLIGSFMRRLQFGHVLPIGSSLLFAASYGWHQRMVSPDTGRRPQHERDLAKIFRRRTRSARNRQGAHHKGISHNWRCGGSGIAWEGTFGARPRAKSSATGRMV